MADMTKDEAMLLIDSLLSISNAAGKLPMAIQITTEMSRLSPEDAPTQFTTACRAVKDEDRSCVVGSWHEIVTFRFRDGKFRKFRLSIEEIRPVA